MNLETDASIVREVTERIDLAIRKNRHQERVVIAVLVLLFAVGVGLLVYGAAAAAWGFLASGGLLQLAILLPVDWLVRLRADNLRLQILPQLLRLADSAEA